MKKKVICLAIATVAVSCKKVPQGGNRGTLKLEEGGVERYSDDPQGEAHGHEAGAAEHKEEAHATPEAAAPKLTVLRLQNLLKLIKRQKLNTN